MIPHPVNPVRLPALGDERAARAWLAKDPELGQLVIPIPDTGGKVFTLMLEFLRSEAEDDYDTWSNARASEAEKTEAALLRQEHINVSHTPHPPHPTSNSEYLLDEHDLIAMLSLPDTYKNTRLVQAIIIHPLLPKYAYLKIAEAVDQSLSKPFVTEPVLPLASMTFSTEIVDFLYYAEQSPVLPLDVHARFLNRLPGLSSSAASSIRNAATGSRWVDMILEAAERDASRIYDYLQRNNTNPDGTPMLISEELSEYLTIPSVFYTVDAYVDAVKRNPGYRSPARDVNMLNAMLWIARTGDIEHAPSIIDIVNGGHFTNADPNVLHEITSLCLVSTALR